MKDKKQIKLYKLLNFLNNDFPENTRALRENLEASGINMSLIEEKLNATLKEADRAIRRKKLDQAKVERSSFGESLKAAATTVFGFGSRRDLVDAILLGRFGTTAQGRLQVQFRNRNPEELSDDDLKALLEDQKILELLEKHQGGQKK